MNSLRQRSKQRLWLYLAINLMILVVTGLVARTGKIGPLEANIFHAVNSLPNGLNLLFLILTQAGSAWMLFGLTLLLIGLRKHRLALRLFAVGSTGLICSEVLKNIIGRMRPSLILDTAVVRDYIVFDFGFPSGHTTMATCMALVMMSVVPPRWRWLCGLWIAVVALSRIYLGVHAPLDVVGGFALGVSVVCLSQLVPGKLRYVRKITGLKLTD